MRAYIDLLFWSLITLFAFLLLTDKCSAWSPMSLDQFDLKLLKFEENRDPMTPQIREDAYIYRVTSDFNISILGVFFWENDVHAEAVSGAVKTVGWKWDLGIRVFPWLDLLHEHHSRHVLDEVQQVNALENNKYPVEDSYGIRLHVYTNPTKPGTLWK